METKECTVDVGSGRTIRLRLPASPEKLLADIVAAEFAKDERMPYWSELWPSSIGLARFLLSGAARVAGADVLELGAGLGLGGVAAAAAGARAVVFTDYFQESLDFAAENARLNGITAFETRLLDWRAPDLSRHYEVVIGSDLLYEVRNRAALANALAAALAPDGVAWIADPGRSTAAGFDEKLAQRGLLLDPEPRYVEVIERACVKVFRITHAQDVLATGWG
jgi:predicted nicotinamide N-methyase